MAYPRGPRRTPTRSNRPNSPPIVHIPPGGWRGQRGAPAGGGGGGSTTGGPNRPNSPPIITQPGGGWVPTTGNGPRPMGGQGGANSPWGKFIAQQQAQVAAYGATHGPHRNEGQGAPFDPAEWENLSPEDFARNYQTLMGSAGARSWLAPGAWEQLQAMAAQRGLGGAPGTGTPGAPGSAGFFPLDPQAEAARRMANDQYEAALGMLGPAREQLAAQGKVADARLRTNEAIAGQNTLESLAARGVYNSGITGLELGDVATQAARTRADLGAQLAQGFGDLDLQQSQAAMDYQRSLQEILLDWYSRQAQDPQYAVTSSVRTGGQARGNRRWTPSWQPTWQPRGQR